MRVLRFLKNLNVIVIMNTVTTMNLSDSDGGMTSLVPQAKIERQPDAPSKNLIYSATIMNEEKKIDTNIKKEMDSTPISDIMTGNDIMQEQQDPRIFQQYPQQQQQYKQPHNLPRRVNRQM